MRGCMVVVLVLAALALLVTILGGVGANNAPDRPAGNRTRFDFEAQARGHCIGALKDRLHSPSSMRLVPPMDVRTDGSRWKLTGQLDADNAFGAAIRSRYLCELTHLGGDRWSVDRVAME